MPLIPLVKYTRGILPHFFKSSNFQEKELYITSTHFFDGVTQLLYKCPAGIYKVQPAITCSMLTTGTLGQNVKYVQS